MREERLKAYAEKKSKKPALIAKTRYGSFSAFSWIVIEEELFLQCPPRREALGRRHRHGRDAQGRQGHRDGGTRVGSM